VRDRLGRHERYSSQAATAMWRDVAFWPIVLKNSPVEGAEDR